MPKRTKREEVILRHIRNRIVKHYDPEKIILFGSRAAGSAQRESDFDLLIIKQTRRHPIERSMEVSSLFRDRDFGLDVIVRTPAEVKRRLQWGDFFYKRRSMTYGRVLYEKS